MPQYLREEMLSKIHNNHVGMIKCKERARSCIYWPYITYDLENLVSNCYACLKNQNKNQNEPMIAKEIPLEPWLETNADLFQFGKSINLLVVDSFSKFI